MKKILLILIAIIASFAAKAQVSDTTIYKGDTSVFKSSDHLPQFAGGENKFSTFLRKTIRYPGKAVEYNTQGKVLLSFIVEKDGTLTDIKVIGSVSPELDAESIRVMKLSPKWQPGILNGQPVRVHFSSPISYTLNGG